jgi:hypothetical protein
MTARLNRYCLCGGSMTGRAGPAGFAAGLAAAFDEVHAGDGHGEATAAQASAARRREERKLLKEMED